MHMQTHVCNTNVCTWFLSIYIYPYIYIPQKTVLQLSENLTSAVEFPRNVLCTFRRICNKEGGTHLKNAGSKLPKLAILLSKLLLKIITTTSTTKTTEPSKGDILANPPVFVDPTPRTWASSCDQQVLRKSLESPGLPSRKEGWTIDASGGPLRSL